MKKLSEFLSSRTGRRVLNFAYSWGACLVILGALFKISHYPYDDLLLLIGMGTEVIVFFISGFESPDKGYKWERVFPQLDGRNDTAEIEKMSGDTSLQKSIGDMGDKLDRINGILDGVYENFAQMQKNCDTAVKGSDMLNEETKRAVEKMSSLNNHYAKVMDVMNIAENKKK